MEQVHYQRSGALMKSLQPFLNEKERAESVALKRGFLITNANWYVTACIYVILESYQLICL